MKLYVKHFQWMVGRNQVATPLAVRWVGRKSDDFRLIVNWLSRIDSCLAVRVTSCAKYVRPVWALNYDKQVMTLVLHLSINCQNLTKFVALFLSELGLLLPDTEENSILTILFPHLYRAFLILSSLLIYPTNAPLDCPKRMLAFTLIFTLRVMLHVSV
jgi:hypothetical protein